MKNQKIKRSFHFILAALILVAVNNFSQAISEKKESPHKIFGDQKYFHIPEDEGNGCAPLPSGIISWWGGDNNALDIIGDNDGTLVNGTTYSAGVVGQAFDLDGTDDYVQVASPSGLPLGNSPRTMMIWFRTPKDLSIYTESSLIQYGTPSNYCMFGLITSGNAPGKLYFYGHNADLAGTTTVLPNTWYHGAITYDGTTVRLYLNGQEEASGARTLNTAINTEGLTMGYRSVGSRWQGELDEPAIFNRALSAEEIAAIYNAGSAGMCRPCFDPPSSLVSWWRAENSAVDSVGPNNGALQCGTTYDTGKVGQAFSLDGVDDYISVGNSGLPTGASPRTIAAWIKFAVPGVQDTRRIFCYGSNWEGARFDLSYESGLGLCVEMVNHAKYFPWVPDTEWHYLASVVPEGASNTGDVLIYFDGALMAAQDHLSPKTLNTTSENPLIGKFNYPYYYQHNFYGLIDEMEVYSRALTANEIASIYNAGSAGKCIYHDLTVSKSGTGNGTITSSPAGIDCGTDCAEEFLSGTTVTLTATASSGSYFAGWTGDCASCGTSPECQVIVNSAKTCIASFVVSPPGEAGKSGSPLTAQPGTGTAVNISFSPSNCATDHSVYWGTGPISGGLNWTSAVCGLGSSGSASFDPGAPVSGSFYYFVVVGNNGINEGSYGRNSLNEEREEATEIMSCDFAQQLNGACD